MIDTWFNKDLEKIYADNSITVFIDESKEAEFLLNTIDKQVTIFEVNTDLEELKVKYDIEKAGETNKKYLLYTHRSKDQLKFIREYCETNGSIEIRYLQNYVKDKVHKQLNLNLNLDKDELISAAKVSVGKDQTYWMDLSHKGSSEIFDLEKELLPFLDNPKSHLVKYDTKTQEIFFRRINELIEQTYIKKPPTTLANEVVNYLLEGLANNNPNKVLLDVYKNWLDSNSYQKSFYGYLKKYKLREKSDIFEIHSSHPFIAIDELWLKKLGENITNKSFISDFIPKINQRISDGVVKNLDIKFWTPIKVLLEFDEKNINQLATLDECISFYTNHFYKLDNAIRKLYAEFLNKKDLLEPLQGYYKNIVTLFLDKWFRYIEEYAPNQLGTIQNILDENTEKTAIIVGDGISFEFSKDITVRISNEFKLEKEPQYMFAGLPSETEHNMSQLYVQSGKIMSKKADREVYLKNSNSDKEIGFIDLDTVNEQTDNEHYLICSHKDPDKLGETYQQKALVYFDKVADLYALKIEQLLRNGYRNVYLVTDHGFVLTGILENSDKIEVDFTGKVKKSERYIRSAEKQSINIDLLHEEELKYHTNNYCYFAKRLGPFKTPGVYGFSHGGLSPQETIIPFLKWSKTHQDEDSLGVSIANKANLAEITGDLFSIHLMAESNTKNLFTSERKIILMMFAEGTKINESEVLLIERDKVLKREYSFGAHSTIQIKLIDALTKEQLGKVTINQNKARDLGGLL
ncbi:hypothetical protein [Ulvibacter litoralis]|uniref:PglZ domain-containing protein n=1 Tax=Ulvibacter litoralis TaxID=227084 RepID=A0A1G7CN61_9FLAO|nr:hypothetical protein [Ulvibacter litoralis]GHC46750.1 hypothetical protein GCM10008083_07270 [Ulvibacter litoralis]SDE40778.1 hypothetical protein SAMN05421855_101470 [Ulvibacter litoralis]